MGKEHLIQQLTIALKSADIDTLKSLAKELVLLDEQEALGYYFLSEAYILEEDWENAELLMAKAMDTASENIPYMLRLAYIKECQDEMPDARMLYDLVLDAESDNISALVGMARYYFEAEGDTEEALVSINQAEAAAIAHNAIDVLASIVYLKIKILLENGDTELALDLVNETLKTNQGHELYLLKLEALSTLIHVLEGQEAAPFIAEAETTFQSCMILFPAYIEDFRSAYATFLAQTQQFEKAEALFNDLLKGLDSKKEEDKVEIITILQSLTNLYEQIGNTEKHIEVLSRIIDLDNTSWDAYASRAALYVKNNDFKSALADYKTAKKYVSTASLPYFLKEEGDFYLSIKDYKSAFNSFKELATFKFEEGMEDNSLLGEGYLGMAKVYQVTGTAPTEKIFEATLKAIKLGTSQAINFAMTHCAALYAQYNATFLDSFKPYFEENKQNPFLQQCFNKVWKFDPKANDLSYLPADVYKDVVSIFEKNIFFFTEQGLLSYDIDAEAGNVAFYKVNKMKKTGITLEVTPTTGEAAYEMQFTMKKGQLAYIADESDEDDLLILQGVEVNALSIEDKAQLKAQFAKVDLSLLGENAKPLSQVLQ